jgi:hypothetical protein
MSIGLHYGDIDFDVVGRGCALGRSESDILTIGSSTTQGVEVLTSKVLATAVRL